ncbi:MAG: hypothetical protein MJ104_03485 [Lachnospiraceae bacterium]|nr:hypothetical protein [Lachnospiraceae bacterium]
MKKRLFAVVACVMLVLSLVGCGMKKMTFQEIYESSDAIRNSFDQELNQMKIQNAQDYSDIQIKFNGNEITYIFTFRDAISTDYQSTFSSLVSKQFESLCKNQITSLRSSYNYLADDAITMVMKFNNPNGEEYYTYTYTEGQ